MAEVPICICRNGLKLSRCAVVIVATAGDGAPLCGIGEGYQGTCHRFNPEIGLGKDHSSGIALMINIVNA